MGKKGGKSSKGGSSGAKSQSQPNCTCDHPYQCNCGNRPERPSKGHKWYPEEQIWAGKGHKQKGGSGQTASISKEAVVTKKGKTKIEQWQKLPSQLLADVCKREKRPPPKYKALDKNIPSGKHKYRCIVQDAKQSRRGGEHDIILIPREAVENEEQAREESALLALLQLTPKIPHERKLPEPYKTTWVNAVASMSSGGGGAGNAGPASKKKGEGIGGKLEDKKRAGGGGGGASSSKASTASSSQSKPHNKAKSATSSNLTLGKSYSTMSERRKQMDEKRRERNARIAKHEAVRNANRDHQVYMSAQVRKRIETLLRGDYSSALALSDDSEDEEEDVDNIDMRDDGENEEESEIRVYILQRLSHEGFTSRQARTAYAEVSKSAAGGGSSGDVDERMDSMYEECLQWLCIHLDEEHLPEGFDPRGRTLDVVVSGKYKASKSSSTTKPAPQAAGGKVKGVAKDVLNFASKYGITDEESAVLLQSADNDADKAKALLWKALSQAAGVDLSADSSGAANGDNEIMEEELEALEAIFPPEECSIRRSQGDKGKSTTVVIAFPSDDGLKVQLEVEILDSLYPYVHPKSFVTGNWRGSNKMPQGVGTAVHVEIVKFLGTLSTGDPMVYELYGFVQGLLPLLPDGLSIPIASGSNSTLLPHLEGGEAFTKPITAVQTSQNADRTGNSSNAPQAESKNRSRNGNNGCGNSGNSGNNAPRQRRPRVKSFFWSKKPRQTPPAVAFPKLSPSMDKARKGLPAAKARKEFLSIMKRAEKTGRVVLVTGETGCGKTTQIPQFILEEAPLDAKIVVAQPRRLAATGVANRVADERGEDTPGKASVGYVVRGDTAMCDSTRLMFCTTGVLLRQLQSDGALDCITHVLVDECHERHLDTDVLLGVLKSCLASTLHLKVVLMSATMDADRFAAYWGDNTPRMHIPGFTYPVKDYTLEDVLSLTGYIPPKTGKKKKRFNNNGGGYRGGRKKSAWNDSEWSDDEGDEGKEDEEEEVSVAESSATTSSGKTNPQAPSIPIEDLVKRVNESDIDYDMIAILVGNLLQNKQSDDDGSVLIFLPGAPEIGKAETAVRRIVRNAPMLILPLHGGLQSKDQSRVFSKAERGVTKVILATNVAETSITIPDCTIVIDTCREKQSSYDPNNRMPLLIERFASRDSLKQRRGRAGRVRSGSCYKLISRATHDKLPKHGEPEIRRCALDQTLLSLLFLGVERGSGNFLSKLLDPPSQESIDAAVFSLEKLGAVSIVDNADRSLVLTPLGMHLAGIPAPPSVGKILVMGSLMGCRSAALAIAAGMSVGRSPFLKIDTFKFNRKKSDDEEESMEEYKQKKVLEARSELFQSVGNSDLALLAAVYLQWDGGGAGGGQKKKLCESLGLSFNGMRDMKQLVRQLDSAISSSGFYNTKEADAHANSWRIIRSCIVAALAPSQIVRVQRPGTKYAETAEGAIEKEGKARELKFFTRGDESENTGGSTLNRRYNGVAEERVFMHPSSANFSVGSYSCPWLVYHELVRTSKAFLRDATECSSYALLLFGGKLDVKASDELIVVDGYARLSANARIGALVGGLRRKVDDLLSKKVADPSCDIAGSVEMKIIVSLLKTDGLGH